MQLQEIPQSQWGQFLDQFSRLHLGQDAQIQTIGLPASEARTHALALPLLGITAEQRAGERTSIEILAAEDRGANLRHVVAKPTRIRAAEWNDGVSAQLLIDSDDGSTTAIRVGPPEEVLPPGFILDGYLPR